jgi:hypothetical protein
LVASYLYFFFRIYHNRCYANNKENIRAKQFCFI